MLLPKRFLAASFSKDRDSELIADFSQELTISKKKHLAHHFANNFIQLIEISVVNFQCARPICGGLYRYACA